jgi:23S rRNA pseudouridine1911/1915/1917 synthase
LIADRKVILTVPAGSEYLGRLDRVLVKLLTDRNLSRSRIEQGIKQGLVSVNDQVIVAPSHRTSTGDVISFDLPEPRELAVKADASVPFTVIYRDRDVLVIDKPAGVVVHPGAGSHQGTLVSGLIHLLGDDLPQLSGAFRPGIVHRLDKDTSGLMVVALTESSWMNLQKQFKPPRTIERTYLAVTLRKPKAGKGSIVSGDSGQITLPVGRDPNSRIKMSSRSSSAKSATTNWKIERELKHGLLLSCSLETGRTHQIRVHLAETGAPIIGDKTYGRKLDSFGPEIRRKMNVIDRQALHAHKLSFLHPRSGDLRSGDRISFESELPDDIIKLIEALER